MIGIPEREACIHRSPQRPTGLVHPNLLFQVEELYCTNQVSDSSRESSVTPGGREQIEQ